MHKSIYKLMFFVSLFLTMTGEATAQVATNSAYKLEQSVIAGGGGASSGTNGTNAFSIEGTIGQAVAGDALSGSSFAVTSGFWNYSPSVPNAVGFEADIATRPFGDSLFKTDDLIQLRLFLNGGATPDTTTNNEFQRADSAPYSSRGDGALCSSDLIQLRRYLNGADTPQAAGGATSQTGSCSAVQATTSPQTEQNIGSEAETEVQTDKAQSPAVARELRVESPPATSAGQNVTVNIRVDALGDEAAYSFRLNYNQTAQTILTNPIINSGTTGAAIVDCDTTSVTNRIGCTVEAFPINQTGSNSASIKEIGVGDNQLLLSITFTVATGATAQTVQLTLSNVSTSNDRAQNLAIAPTSGAVTITGPTAAMVSIGGRVKNAIGTGIGGVTVSLLDAADGQTQTTVTIEDGTYRFENLTVGGSYIITPQLSGYSFTPSSKVISLMEEAADIDFTANRQKSKRQRL
jgi:Carboxypeptidase regulatory-like domain